MRIAQNRPPGQAAAPAATGPGAATARADAAEPRPTRSVAEVATFLGIPEAELTPNVRQGMNRLLYEVEKLRKEIDAKNRRIAYLEKLADEDTLTPLLNRRAFVRELSRMMSYADRYGTTSSVLFFDVNDLKAINDAHGHAVGDAALGHVADMLLRYSRSSDVVGRLGGDEFAVLLAQASQSDAIAKGTDLASRIEGAPFDYNGHAFHVSVSFGAFAFDQSGEPHDILAAADRAMYEHKRNDVASATSRKSGTDS